MLKTKYVWWLLIIAAVFGGRFWYGYSVRGLDNAKIESAKKLAQQLPSFRLIYDSAMADGHLSLQEYRVITKEATFVTQLPNVTK